MLYVKNALVPLVGVMLSLEMEGDDDVSPVFVFRLYFPTGAVVLPLEILNSLLKGSCLARGLWPACKIIRDVGVVVVRKLALVKNAPALSRQPRPPVTDKS